MVSQPQAWHLPRYSLKLAQIGQCTYQRSTNTCHSICPQLKCCLLALEQKDSCAPPFFYSLSNCFSRSTTLQTLARISILRSKQPRMCNGHSTRVSQGGSIAILRPLQPFVNSKSPEWRLLFSNHDEEDQAQRTQMQWDGLGHRNLDRKHPHWVVIQ